eukprot:482174_1
MARWWSLLLISIPVIVAVYFHFGDELNFLFNKNWVPWKKIVNNEKVIDVDVDLNDRSFIVTTWEGKTKEVFVSQDSKVSSDDLNLALLSIGVDPAGLFPYNDKDIKIPLLFKVSSPDFWRRNYSLHPRKGRISNWLWIHRRYLDQVAALQNINDKDELHKTFVKICGKLDGHARDFEDQQMFKFFKENIKNNDEFLKIIDELEYEHIPIENKAKKIQKDWDNLSLEEIKSQISDVEKDMIKHFTKEEQYIPIVFLNINSSLYRKYRSYLSWKYYFMY